jgi:hypothetical protein
VTTGTDTTSTPCAVVTGNSRYFRVISASDNTQNQPLDFHSESITIANILVKRKAGKLTPPYGVLLNRSSWSNFFPRRLTNPRRPV